MRYISTRGSMQPSSFSEILLLGLAPDGGLTIPEAYPRIDAAMLARMRQFGYADLAFIILRLFCDDINERELHAIVQQTYTDQAFGSREITPLTQLEPGLHLLELSNGPTLAFKDVAMQLLGNLFDHVLRANRQSLNILGATSGDTGGAAEHAMLGKPTIRVFMLSPHGRMSRFQQAQMYGLIEPNIFNIAVTGVFDDCQDLVKAVSADARFKQRYSIGTVNSINWARVAAQVVYYFKAYFAATDHDDQQVSFAVPTGNFGNVLAGHIARMMGLPIRRLVVATNENDVLDEFFRTGGYRPRRAGETFETSSPSMDISKASNFERFVFDLCQRDPARLLELWRRLDRDGQFSIADQPEFARLSEFGFVSGASSHASRLAAIRDVQNRFGRVIDPHTADGLAVCGPWREAGVPMICLETALPAKFDQTIREALGAPAPRPARFTAIEDRPQRFMLMPADATMLKRVIAARALQSY